MATHPPPPGPFVQPNLNAIEEALHTIAFPISKRDLLDQISDEDSVVFHGHNVDLHTLVKDLHDDFFETEAEFQAVLEQEYGREADEDTEAVVGDAPTLESREEARWRAAGGADQPVIPERE